MKGKFGAVVVVAVLVAAGFFGARIVKQRIGHATGMARVKQKLAPCMSSTRFDDQTVPAEDFPYLLMLALDWGPNDPVPDDVAASAAIAEAAAFARGLQSAHHYTTVVMGPVNADESGVHVETRQKVTDYGFAARIQMALCPHWNDHLASAYRQFPDTYKDRLLRLLAEPYQDHLPGYKEPLRTMLAQESDPGRKSRLQALVEKAETPPQEDEAAREQDAEDTPEAPREPPDQTPMRPDEVAQEGAARRPGFRTWTDRQGRTFNGRLVSVNAAAGTVSVRSESGKAYTTPISIYCDRDQEYIRHAARQSHVRTRTR